jgi:hypothetical protein
MPPDETEAQLAARHAAENAYQDAYRKSFELETQLIIEAQRKALTADDIRRILDGAA